ncbi:MAG: RsmD family RNA methyltransferase, partial [Rikenellaceae bacterium]
KIEHGERFLDLTCGLGVDTFHYSRQFHEVVTLERDTLIADIARENFKRLEAKNITVINSECEEYIANYSGEPFDLVYVDPARRDHTKRVFLLEDCSPNIVELIPVLQKITKKVIIKLSPLFDMDEAERIFGSGVTLRAVSVSGECKELCVEIDFESHSCTKIIASCVSKNGEINECQFDKSEINATPCALERAVEEYRYISILDVALRKMRCATGYYKKYHANEKPLFDNDVALWMERPENLAGRCYRIETVMEYKPKLIKELGIKTATIIIQNFDLPMEELRKRLSIKSGSGATLIFTTIRNKQYFFKVL